MGIAPYRRSACGIIIGLGVLRVAQGFTSPAAAGELTTADTAIAVEAGEHAPRLTTLTLPRARAWSNRADEPLPDHVEVHGAPQLLAWRLDRASTVIESTQIQFVYVTESPRLKLLWRWRARAPHGPIEHTILIQNLSSETLWLPLQASLRFDWLIDLQSALERFWVEKGADTPSGEGTHLDVLTAAMPGRAVPAPMLAPSPDSRGR